MKRPDMPSSCRTNQRFAVPATLVVAAILLASPMASAQGRVIELLADKDSRFKIPGEKHAELAVKAGEPLVLRIQARKGKTWSRDGAVHGFTLLHAKSRAKVAGWDFELKPGMQELKLSAPAEPGEYVILCTVICSDDHEGMNMKLIVMP